MNILPVSNSLSFSAQTTIEAPENLISKKDAEKFIEAGEKIGKNSDVISVWVSDVFKNKDMPPKDVFIVGTQTKIGNVCSERNMILPLSVISPKDYLTGFFDKLTQKHAK